MKIFELQDGRKFLYQWDQNVNLLVNDSNITYVHFYHSGDDKSYSVSVVDGLVQIPNELLIKDGQMKVYGYVGNEQYQEDINAEYTKTAFFFDIVAKPKPENFDVSTGAWKNLYQEMHELEMKIENQNNVQDYLSFKLNTDNNSYTCLGFNTDDDVSTKTEITLPETIEGLPVTTIGANAFANNTTLEKVNIPNTISSIEKGAFTGCSKLINYINNVGYVGKWAVAFNGPINEKVEFEAGTVGIIDDFCFEYKTGIDEVIVPESTLYIGAHAFESAYPMNRVTIKNENVVIGYYAFADLSVKYADIPAHAVAYFKNQQLVTLKVNSGDSIAGGEFPDGSQLKEIEFPETLKFIGADAFGKCNAITSVRIPNIEAWCNITFENVSANPLYYITSDGNFYVGKGYEALTKLVVPKTIKEIKDSAFCGYKKLQTVEFENGSACTRIGNYVFHFCGGLTSVELPNSITEIGANAFEQTSIPKIVIPDNVETIGFKAFFGCTQIADIVMSKNIQKIGSQAFGGGVEIYNFYLRSVKSWCTVELGDAFSSPLLKCKNESNLYSIECDGNITKLESLIIPNSVQKITQYCFQGTPTIKELVVPESVNTIEDSAFCFDGNITTVYLPNNLKKIEASAFQHCGGIKTVYYAGTSSQWNSIVIEGYNDNITNASRTYNTSYVESSDVTKVSQLENDAKYITKTDIPTKVSAFENDAGYAKKTEIPCVPTDVGYVIYPSYVECYGLQQNYGDKNKSLYTRIVIASEIKGYPVTVISTSAFEVCDQLREVVIPESITTIRDFAFAGCYNLASITLPKTLTYIGDTAFASCGFKSVYIPKNVTFIGNGAFNINNLTIYCEIREDEKPTGWQEGWNGTAEVIWNQKPATQAYVDEALTRDTLKIGNTTITEAQLNQLLALLNQ